MEQNHRSTCPLLLSVCDLPLFGCGCSPTPFLQMQTWWRLWVCQRSRNCPCHPQCRAGQHHNSALLAGSPKCPQHYGRIGTTWKPGHIGHHLSFVWCQQASCWTRFCFWYSCQTCPRRSILQQYQFSLTRQIVLSRLAVHPDWIHQPAWQLKHEYRHMPLLLVSRSYLFPTLVLLQCYMSIV